MSDNIEGKVVVITGASSGLGEATARLLSAEGASVVLAEMLMGRRLFVAPSDLDVLLMVREGRIDRLDQYGSDLPPTE